MSQHKARVKKVDGSWRFSCFCGHEIHPLHPSTDNWSRIYSRAYNHVRTWRGIERVRESTSRINKVMSKVYSG